MNWTDFAVIAVVVLCATLGYRRGLIATAIRFVKIIATLIVANMFHRPFTDFVFSFTGTTKADLLVRVRQLIQDFLASNAPNMTSNQFSDVLKDVQIPGFLQQSILRDITENAISSTTQMIDVAAQHITDLVVYSIGFVLLALLVFIALSLVERVSRILNKLPIISAFNQGGGMLVGLVQGIVIVMFAVFVASAFRGAGWGQYVMHALDRSLFARYALDYNIIHLLLSLFAAKGA